MTMSSETTTLYDVAKTKLTADARLGQAKTTLYRFGGMGVLAAMLGAGIGFACLGTLMSPTVALRPRRWLTPWSRRWKKRNSLQRATLNWPTDRQLASHLGVRSCWRLTARCEWTHPQL
jgi:hypothetical protein